MLKFVFVLLFTVNAFAEVSCEQDRECPAVKTPVGIGCVIVKNEKNCEEKCIEKQKVRGLCLKVAGSKKGVCTNPVRNPLDYNTSDPGVCAYAMSEKKMDYIFNI